MGHVKLLFIAVLTLIVASATIAFALPMSTGAPGYNPAAYNFPNINPIGDKQYLPFQMRQGWENGQLVWFICTDASDQQVACDTFFTPMPHMITWNEQKKTTCAEFADGLNFAPKLVNAAGSVALMYVITNVNQGPVFTAVPGDPTYSGLWQVIYVTFKPGVTPFCVNNATPFDAVTNPHGLPGPDLATFTTTNRAGLPFVMKCPIMAVGPLGGPWTPAISGEYRIPQGKVRIDYTYTKIIWLPFWFAYCTDPITKAVMKRAFIVPDVWDPTGALTIKLGANNAPGLAAIPASAEQLMYWQVNALPRNQFPILQACPSNPYFPCYNLNFNYTPVDILVQLRRNPTLPMSTVINNESTLLRLLAGGCLTELNRNVILNAPVLPEPPKEHPVVPPMPGD